MPAAAGTDPVNLDWQADAACTSIDPDLWFPQQWMPGDAAIQICSSCPVQAECLDFALQLQGVQGMEVAGIWGGLTATQRRSLKAGWRTCTECATRFQARTKTANELYCGDLCRREGRRKALARSEEKRRHRRAEQRAARRMTQKDQAI